MIGFQPKGAIFDVDDTLLDNNKGGPGFGLHERARLNAVHEVGKRHSIAVLQDYTALENYNAFLNAPVHTLDSAVWQILIETGLADSETINTDNPLLQEIVNLKNEYFATILINEAEPLPGAVQFVHTLAATGLQDKLAIASTAIRADIDAFLKKTGLAKLFPNDRILSKESITHPKPNPEIFNLAFDSLGLTERDRSHVCAFEDDPRGIMSARGAGLYVCAITTRYTRDQLLSLAVPPDFIADNYDQFSEHFDLS